MTTNRYFLASALRSKAFGAGDTTTDFIERVDPSRAATPLTADCRRVAVAATMWLQAAERTGARTLGWMPSGWRHGRLPPERAELAVETAAGSVGVIVSYRPQRDGTFMVRAESGDSATEAPARIAAWSPETLDLEWDGRRIRYAVTAEGSQVRASAHAVDTIFGYSVTARSDRLYLTGDSETVTVAVLPRFGAPESGQLTGGFAAPMPGVIVEVRVEPGEQVAAGRTLVVMEGMKMEHHVSAPCDGTVTEVLVAAGDQVDNGSRCWCSRRPGPAVAEPVRIANCSGFYGDRLSAAAEMVNDGPIDVLTGDWLAELTMLILARTRQKRPGGGYARSFVKQMEQVMGACPRRGHQGGVQRGRARPPRLCRGGRRGRRQPGPDTEDRVRGRGRSHVAAGPRRSPTR